MIQLPQEIIERVSDYNGDGRKLEMALGAYSFAQLYGWRALCMLHSQSTLRDLEQILGVVFSKVCSEETSLSRHVIGIRIWHRLNAFWRVVKGPAFKHERGIIESTTDGQGKLL